MTTKPCRTMQKHGDDDGTELTTIGLGDEA